MASTRDRMYKIASSLEAKARRQYEDMIYPEIQRMAFGGEYRAEFRIELLTAAMKKLLEEEHKFTVTSNQHWFHVSWENLQKE